MAHREFAGLSVPSLITSPADVSRLAREVAALDDYVRQEALRHTERHVADLPKTSHLLNELAAINKLDLLDGATRRHLADFLEDVYANAPVVHISFAADPSTAFLQKVVGWFRENIHPSVLIRVGLQPNIAAGCIVRTTNHYYDFSLREHFKKKRDDLVAALEGRRAA